MISLILVMSVILGAVNLLNYRQVVLDADRTLAFLAENDGEFPRKGKDFDIGDNPKYMSPELARVSSALNWIPMKSSMISTSARLQASMRKQLTLMRRKSLNLERLPAFSHTIAISSSL